MRCTSNIIHKQECNLWFLGMDLQNILFRFSSLNLPFNSLNYDVCVCVFVG